MKHLPLLSIIVLICTSFLPERAHWRYELFAGAKAYCRSFWCGITWRRRIAPISRGPLRRFLDLAAELEDSFEYRVYMKSADGERLSTTDAKSMRIPDGWIYTAMLLRGVVVAETYERRKVDGDSRVNPHEKKGLLIINQGTSTWTELTRMVLPDGTEVEGMTEYNYLRADKKVFAKFERNHAIFIRKELDEKLREKRSIKNAEIDEANKGALVELSISGSL